jgi:hypothetical protein
MGKRSDFPRIDKDAYDTPEAAVVPLLDHLPGRPFTYWEPCAGRGLLMDHINKLTNARCLLASDIVPRREDIDKLDALDDIKQVSVDYIITNPPWSRDLLHPMIENFARLRPTWLLFDSDWMHTKQAIRFMPSLVKIVSVGRVKWMPNSPYSGKDNCCWYLFDSKYLDSWDGHAGHPFHIVFAPRKEI